MQVSFRTIQLTDGKKRVNGALRARAAVRPALRQGSAFLLGLAGGWAVLYGALMPFGLGLTLGFAEDCFAVGAAGAALGVLARSFGTLTVESVCLLCALGAAVAARWLWPGRFVPAVAAGCGTLVGSAVCFAAGEENGVQTILFCGGDALLAAAAGYGLRRFPPEKPGMGSLILSAAVAAALGGMSFGFFLPGVMACAAAELEHKYRPQRQRTSQALGRGWSGRRRALRSRGGLPALSGGLRRRAVHRFFRRRAV